MFQVSVFLAFGQCLASGNEVPSVESVFTSAAQHEVIVRPITIAQHNYSSEDGKLLGSTCTV